MCGKFTQLATWAEVHVFSQLLVVKSDEEGVVSSRPGDEREADFGCLLCSKLPRFGKVPLPLPTCSALCGEIPANGFCDFSRGGRPANVPRTRVRRQKAVLDGGANATSSARCLLVVSGTAEPFQHERR